MANTKQAKKRIRQAEKSRRHNASMRSMLRTYIKKAYAALETKNLSAANESFAAAQPIIDKMVSKGIIHKNKAARHKSRIVKHIKQLEKSAA